MINNISTNSRIHKNENNNLKNISKRILDNIDMYIMGENINCIKLAKQFQGTGTESKMEFAEKQMRLIEAIKIDFSDENLYYIVGTKK